MKAHPMIENMNIPISESPYNDNSSAVLLSRRQHQVANAPFFCFPREEAEYGSHQGYLRQMAEVCWTSEDRNDVDDEQRQNGESSCRQSNETHEANDRTPFRQAASVLYGNIDL